MRDCHVVTRVILCRYIRDYFHVTCVKCCAVVCATVVFYMLTDCCEGKKMPPVIAGHLFYTVQEKLL